METVLVRLREPVMRLPQDQAENLIKLGLLEPAREYRAAEPAEPEALVRVKESGMSLGSYYNKGEIVGCTQKDAEYFLWRGLVEPVTREQRDAEVERAREEGRKRAAEAGDLTLVRFLVSWAVFGTYYCAGEVAGFSGDRLKEVLGARMKDGERFVHQLSAEEVKELEAKLESDQAASAAEAKAGTDHLVLLEFLISTSAAGSYYNEGEVAGFTPEKAAELVAMHTLQNQPFVKVVKGEVTPLPPPVDGAPLEIPEDVDVAGLTDRDPEGVAEKQESEREAAEAAEKGLDAPPKHRMLDRLRRKS